MDKDQNNATHSDAQLSSATNAVATDSLEARLAQKLNLVGSKTLETLSFNAGFGHDADFLALNDQPIVNTSVSEQSITGSSEQACLPVNDLSVEDLEMAGITNSIKPSAASIQMLDPDIYNHPCEKIILTVGNNMMGDDGAGPALAQKIIDNPIDGWLVIDSGTIPEDSLHILRRLKPKMLVLVDAAEMAEDAGTVRIIDPDTIADLFIMSTHALPLNFLLDELQQFIPRVEFIGIQPATVAFSSPMTEMVKAGVLEVYRALQELTDINSLLPTQWSE